MKNTLVLLSLFIFQLHTSAQIARPNTKIEKPKLVIGLVVDQMRWDYLYRFAGSYGNNGFKRLMNEGFNCENTFINYTPTYTAAGHACVYTGSVPALNGIIGNNWYNRSLKRDYYCTEDSTVTTIGSTSTAGKMSPVNLWATTVTDELRLASNFKSKVIGIALKDRGAILPAGHSANAAYWFDDATGTFITSSYYLKILPAWLQSFNNQNLPAKYLQQNWNTLYPLDTYTASTADSKPYEANLPGANNTFPHLTSAIQTNKYNSFRYTPMANTYTFDMAKAALEGEQMGKGAETDFLALSLSSTDYIGHEFGPNSIEVEDTYIRLDKDLAAFLTYLDNTIGKSNYTFFLTADHAVAHVPGFLQENRIPAGTYSSRKIQDTLNKALNEKYKIKNLVERVINYQVYLNKKLLEHNRMAVVETVIEELLRLPFIANALELQKLSTTTLPAQLKHTLSNGYNQKLSGDIQFIYKPNWFDGSGKGTTHGSWNAYDSHIPLLWYGWGVKKGRTLRETYMTDIASTLASILNIQMPSGSIGKVIEEVRK